MRLSFLLLVLCMLHNFPLGFHLEATSVAEAAQAPRAPSLSQGTSTTQQRPRESPPPDRYVLTPKQRAKAVAYARATYTIYFLGVGLSALIYFLIWWLKIGAKLRNWISQISHRLFVQCLVFVPIIAVLVTLLELPLDYYSGFTLEHHFGLSTQTLASWFADWAKALGLFVLLAVPLVWIFYLVVRRSPRRWWLYFWLLSVPIALAIMAVEPYVIEPLFFKFTPLEKTHPELTSRIEEMLHHANLNIPRSRIFEMNASAKTKTLNAYVSGFGASKRVVVWDTTLKALTQDEVLLVLGHETGHYVLHHVIKEFVLIELLALLLFYLGFILLDRIVLRRGPRTGIAAVGDLASLPLAALVLTLLWFLASPIVNGISRHFEHQADQFALEVNYGVVKNPNAAEARAFEVLGREDLSDPDPNPFIKFWLYSHPPLDARIRFAATYKPWAEGKPLRFVHPHPSP